MKLNVKSSVLMGIVFVGILFLLGTAGVVSAAKHTYVVGHIANLTGVYGPGTRGLNEGFLDAIEMINEYGNLPVSIL